MMIDFVPDETLYPFESRWFDSSAGRVHYVDEGFGPPILFCHGSPTWSFLYRHIVAGLRDRYRCIAVDHLGFGLSERPESFDYRIAEHSTVLGELIDHLQLDGFVVMGHDWGGGPIGLSAAAERAGRVRGIVLGNTVFWPIEPLANRAFSAIMSSGPMQRRILAEPAGGAISARGGTGRHAHRGGGRPLPPGATDGEIAARACGHAQGNSRRPPAVGPPRPGRTCSAGGAQAGAGSMGGCGTSFFRPGTCIPRIRAAFADLDVVELPPRAGHFVQEYAPDEIVSAIARRFP